MSFRNLIDSYSHNIAMKAESLTPQAAYITNGAGFAWGAMTFNQWVMLVTLILGVLTFFVNLYFQWRRNEREKRHESRESEVHAKQMNRGIYKEPRDDTQQ